MFAIILTPILRGRVSCLGSQYCFPLAFGVPGVLMVMALLLFLCGWKIYRVQPPSQENIAFEVVGCIWTGAKRYLFGSVKHESCKQKTMQKVVEACRSLARACCS